MLRVPEKVHDEAGLAPPRRSSHRRETIPGTAITTFRSLSISSLTRLIFISIYKCSFPSIYCSTFFLGAAFYFCLFLYLFHSRSSHDKIHVSSYQYKLLSINWLINNLVQSPFLILLCMDRYYQPRYFVTYSIQIFLSFSHMLFTHLVFLFLYISIMWLSSVCCVRQQVHSAGQPADTCQEQAQLQLWCKQGRTKELLVRYIDRQRDR